MSVPNTTKQSIASVYLLLRRPSITKLPHRDVRKRLNDVLRSYIQEMNLSPGRQRRTETTAVTVTADDIDYIVALAGVQDFEPVRLEYRTGTGAWYEAVLVPFEHVYLHNNQPSYVAACFYGYSELSDTIKVRLNLSTVNAAAKSWRLAYRAPQSSVVGMADTLPIPTDFLPMIEVETALLCLPIVSDTTPEWSTVKKELADMYTAELSGWKARWSDYLMKSNEPPLAYLKETNTAMGARA